MKFKRIIRKITHNRKIEINQSAEIKKNLIWWPNNYLFSLTAAMKVKFFSKNINFGGRVSAESD